MERCEVCHDMPPQDSGIGMETHYNHVIDSTMGRSLKCWQCHLNCDTIMKVTIQSSLDSMGKTISDTIFDTLMSWTLDSLHRDGRPELDLDDRQCHLCHDYQFCDECHQTPPNDVSNPESQRVHNVHVTRQGFKCDMCHKDYDVENKRFPVTIQRIGSRNVLVTLHDNGDTDVVFNVLKKPGYAIEPTYNITASTCNNLYCHGAMTIGGKPSVAITDIMPQDSTKCSFCHDINTLLLNGPTHQREKHVPLFPDCLNCHPGFRLSTLATDEAKHRNGVLNRLSGAECDAACHSTPHVIVP